MTPEQAYINGFVKRASEYGFSEDKAIEILKTAEEAIGPFDAERAADMLGAELKLRSIAYNKKNHPKHYYFNPFVSGPLSELLVRFNRRSNAGLAEDEMLANQLLGGLALNAYRGGEKSRDRVREKFNKTILDYSPEGED
jgi:hypothetical protein